MTRTTMVLTLAALLGACDNQQATNPPTDMKSAGETRVGTNMQDRDTGAGTPAAVAEPENAKQTADVARNDEQRRNEYTSRSRSELQALAAKFNTIRDNAGASGRARLREAEEPLASANRHLRALETAKESRWEDIRKQYETSFATARNAIERVSRGH